MSDRLYKSDCAGSRGTVEVTGNVIPVNRTVGSPGVIERVPILENVLTPGDCLEDVVVSDHYFTFRETETENVRPVL